MTADVYPFDAAFLSRVATRIVNEVQGINHVVYDLSRSRGKRSSRSDVLAGTEPACHLPYMQVTAVLTPAAEGGFTAFNPETGTVSQGESLDEALANLREAVELYLEEFPDLRFGTPFVTVLQLEGHA